MNQTIFRKKSIERISSPEQLNQYIKVSRPSIWLILAAVILLLGSVAVWSVVGRLDTIVSGHAIVQSGRAVCLLTQQDAQKIAQGMAVETEGASGVVVRVWEQPQSFEMLSTSFDEYALYAAGITAEGWWCPVEISLPVADGIHPVKLVVESVSPASFLFN